MEEIDVRIAKEVMGWEMKPAEAGSARFVFQCWHENGETLTTVHGWNPSTNIEHPGLLSKSSICSRRTMRVFRISH